VSHQNLLNNATNPTNHKNTAVLFTSPQNTSSYRTSYISGVLLRLPQMCMGCWVITTVDGCPVKAYSVIYSHLDVKTTGSSRETACRNLRNLPPRHGWKPLKGLLTYSVRGSLALNPAGYVKPGGRPLGKATVHATLPACDNSLAQLGLMSISTLAGIWK
jgi:hypothetical protein